MPSYTEDDISAAIRDVANGKAVKTAARDSGVPDTTLQYRIRAGNSVRTKKEILLTPDEEKFLKALIVSQEALGLRPVNPKIRDMAQRILALRGFKQPIPKAWPEKFIKRNKLQRPRRAKISWNELARQLMMSQPTNGGENQVTESGV